VYVATRRKDVCDRCCTMGQFGALTVPTSMVQAMSNEDIQGDEWGTYVALDTYDEDVPRDHLRSASSIGDGVRIVVAGATTCRGVWESQTQGEVAQVIRTLEDGRYA
jgi:hypothetical protein